MNSRARKSFTPLVCLALLLSSGRVQADLAEATDHAGIWRSGSLDSSGQPGPGGHWTPQSDTTLDGVDAAEGRLDDGAVESWMETTVSGPVTLYFSHRVKDLSKIAMPGVFLVAVGDTNKQLSQTHGNLTADSGWLEDQVEIPAGTHPVRWILRGYARDNPVRAYVDQVWTSRDPRPRILPWTVKHARVGDAIGFPIRFHSLTHGTLSATGLPPGISIPPGLAYYQLSGTPATVGAFDAKFLLENSAGRHVARWRFDVQPGKTSFSEALDAPALYFYQADGASVWQGATGLGHDGMDAARATLLRSESTGPKGHPLATTVEGPGTLEFWYRTDERALYHLHDTTILHAYLGHVTPLSFPVWTGGAQVWTPASMPIPHGTQTITWGARRVISKGIPPPLWIEGPLYIDLDAVKFTPATEPPPPQYTFSSWAEVWSVGTRPATDDSDGDGLTLLMEYATGGSPFEPNPELLPTVSVVDGHFTLKLLKASSPTDLLYFVQGNRSLLPNAWSTSSIEVLDEDGSHILARCKKPIAEEPDFHMRVRVLLTP